MTMVILFIAISNISSASSDEKKTITVMSRNLYIGTDLGPMINASNQTALVEAINTVFTELQATDFPTRAKALATEIATKQPDIIGLQEAVLIRSQYPSDLSPIPDATTIEMDLVPGLLPDGSCCKDFRLTDREVILARQDLQTANLSNIKKENFNNNLIIPFLDRNFTMLYGWASADVEVQGKLFRWKSAQ